MFKVIGVACATLFLCASSQAQTTVDVSKITCEQYNLFKVADPQKIAIWLSGFYHGTRNDMILEPQRLQEESEQVTKFCYLNPKAHVLEAVKKVVGAGRGAGR